MSALPWTQELENLYTFKPKFGDPVCMAVRKGMTLYVPRETVPTGEIDKRISFPPVAYSVQPLAPRNEEQEPLILQSIALLKAGKNHIFDAPTGWGKTVAGSYVGAAMGQPTMIVVTKDDLLDAWKETLIDVLGVPPSKIGRVQQDECDFKDKWFTIGMVHSLVIPDRYPPEMYDSFGLVIFDEVHMMATDHFVHACYKFPALYRLGFSATVERPDGKTKLIRAHLGDCMVRGTMVPMSPKVLVKKTEWKIPQYKDVVQGHVTYTKIPHKPGAMMLVSKAQAKNIERNQIITRFVTSAHKADRKVLIMSDLKDAHLDLLFHMFVEAGIGGHEIGYYVGGMSKLEIEMTKKKSVVLATYQMCATGTNVPHWDSLVMATPRANIKQAIGRVLRFVDGKKEPVILDLVDHDAIFASFFRTRVKQYQEVGAKMVYL